MKLTDVKIGEQYWCEEYASDCEVRAFDGTDSASIIIMLLDTDGDYDIDTCLRITESDQLAPYREQ